ncbi:alpha/beta hydrolase [Paenibacillus qinlingensis]|uniref:Pimeloyl-ACP methyl ester carboxylesterase n=1 Tax=Paenibacillus qinlingensis TaxID=1837343 RepID=A0ABU1NSB6_9BACL|nr:alpha/beta hydrolase [Paenibacillus qinlingensis]MDR6550219.1 pimeloyl-ACP methyl ester carboxylesterase [Paenibacillus qinlingensis]
MTINTTSTKKPVILFIHGAFMTPDSWSPMRDYFIKQGFETMAPAWPYHARSIEELKNNPADSLGKLGLAEVVDHYVRIIRALPVKPIIIGHSFGGLITQILMDRNLGAAGIAIDPAASKGINAGAFKTAKKSVASILLKPWRKTVSLTFEQFQYAFVNTMPLNEQKEAFRYAVPETTRIFFQSAFASFNSKSPLTVNFDNGKRGPLLIIAGEKDHIVPAAMVKKNFELYNQNSGAATQFVEFPKRSHWIIAEKGYEEVADHIINWIERNRTDA